MKWGFLMLLLASPGLARGPSDPLPGTFILFPSSDVWNRPINNLPLNTTWTLSDLYTTDEVIVPVFGTTYAGTWNGSPYNIVCGGVTPLNTNITWGPGAYTSESAPIPDEGLPLPLDAIMEGDANVGTLQGGGDDHIVLVDTCTNLGYDIFEGSRTEVWGGAGTSYSGAWTILQLTTWTYTNVAQWPNNWTTANAAGTPFLPELVNWNEVNAGVITHAVGFTMPFTHSPHVWPARHDANTGSVTDPPLGLRLRLKSSYDISGFSAANQVILTALKTYGMILIDNGGYWNLAGAPSPNWNDSDLSNLRSINISPNFEIVDESAWMSDPSSDYANAPYQSPSSQLSGHATINGKATIQ